MTDKTPPNKTLIAERNDPGAAEKKKLGRAVLTTASIEDTGRVLGLSDHHTILLGRGEECTFRFEDESVSGRHAQLSLLGSTYVLADCNSTNGTFLNEERLTRPTPLRSGDRLRLGPRLVLRFNLMDEEEERALTRIYEAALLDGLTRIWNRKHMDERLDAELAYCVRHNSELALLMLDVDHFKKVNDSYGHPAGDSVLRHLAELLRLQLRTEDLLARYGGEEFIIGVRGASRVEVAVIGERIRAAVEASRVESDSHTLAVTISLGAAVLSELEPKTKEALIARADARLYRAKQRGRNQLCLDDE